MHHVAQDPPPTIFQRHQVRIEEVPQQRLIGSPSDPADGGQSGVGTQYFRFAVRWS
jgi:hypothetical protein